MADGPDAPEAVMARMRLPALLHLWWLRWALSGFPGSGFGPGLIAAFAEVWGLL